MSNLLNLAGFSTLQKVFFKKIEKLEKFSILYLQKVDLPENKPRVYFNGVSWIINDPKKDLPEFDSKMPSGYLTAKDNKSSFLRSQSRSRSPSPAPHSRSQSPFYPDLPGKRKDYSKGRVCKSRPKMIDDYTQPFFSRSHSTASFSVVRGSMKSRNGNGKKMSFVKPGLKQVLTFQVHILSKINIFFCVFKSQTQIVEKSFWGDLLSTDQGGLKNMTFSLIRIHSVSSGNFSIKINNYKLGDFFS